MISDNDNSLFKTVFKEVGDSTRISGFEDILRLPSRDRKKSPVLAKLIAATVLVSCVAAGYLFFTQNRSHRETVGQFPDRQPQYLPSQILLDKSVSSGYIWNWKASTDQLLEDADKFTKIKL